MGHEHTHTHAHQVRRGEFEANKNKRKLISSMVPGSPARRLAGQGTSSSMSSRCGRRCFCRYRRTVAPKAVSLHGDDVINAMHVSIYDKWGGGAALHRTAPRMMMMMMPTSECKQNEEVACVRALTMMSKEPRDHGPISTARRK